MAHLTITVHGRPYTVACDDGEEDHLKGLAAGLDERMAELAASVGPVGEARLFLMASLLLSDELADRNDRLQALEAELDGFRTNSEEAALARLEISETAIAEALEAAATRVEQLARKLG